MSKISLESAKIGDKLFYCNSTWLGKHYSFYTVTKITQTQVICDGQRFRKDSATFVGGDWFRHVEPVTPKVMEDYAFYKKQTATTKAIKDVLLPKIHLFSNEQLDQINAIISTHSPKETP